MCKYTIAFERPWVFALLAVAALLMLLPYFMTPRNKRVSVGRILSLVARGIAMTVAILLLAGTTFTEVSSEPRPTSVVFVIDVSDSDSTVYGDMIDYASDLIDRAEEKTEFSAVWFADGIVGTTDFTADRAVAKANLQERLSSEGRYDATNIAGALRYAGDLFPENTRNNKRVILLSDGRETVGNAFYAAQILTGQGIRLDAVPFDVTASGYAEVALTDFVISPKQVLRQGESLTMQAVIYSTVETQVTLTFYDGNDVIKSLNLAINIGENQFSQVYTPSKDMLDGRLREPGVHELRAQVTPKDPAADHVVKNNRMYTWTRVTPTEKLLLVDGDGTQASAVLSRIEDQYALVDVCTPNTFPETMKALLKYDEVALLNVNARELPVGADRMLSLYVNVVGRGLLTSSGTTEQSYLSYADTELESLLPLTVTLDETDHNVAMVIVIDDSYSMKNTGVDRFTPALEGAKKIIGVLSETDYVGVVTFHGDATVWDRGMVKVTDKEELCAAIDQLECKPSNLDTSYDKALNAARGLLQGFKDAQSLHVVFLTDGEPTDAGYESLPTTLRNNGITLSTISLLATSHAQDILSDMAQKGGGEYRSVNSAEQLDELSGIMEDLAKKAKEPQFVNTEPFNLRVRDSSTGVLNNVGAVTSLQLNGYIGSTLKLNAQMAVFSDDSRPVIAEWKRGAGHVVSFMSDFTTWCTPLYEDATGDGTTLVRNLFRQALNEQVDSTSITVSVGQSDGTMNLSCETGFRLWGQTLRLYISETGVVGIDEIESGSAGDGIECRQLGAVYRAAYQTEDPNRLFYMTVVVTDADGAVYDYVYTGFSGGPIAEYRLFENDGAALLAGITGTAGGSVMQDPDEVMSVIQPSVHTYVTRAFVPLMTVLGILILADILCRTVTFDRKRKKP